jgi:transcription-repair coupling factor (superfamily II helicase)
MDPENEAVFAYTRDTREGHMLVICNFSGDEVPFEDMGALLVGMGYIQQEGTDRPGTFHVHGDTVDVYPAQATSPVRIEFFGDEIDRIRRMVPSTGQTIGELKEVVVGPCRELALTDKTVRNAARQLYSLAQEDTQVAADLELIQSEGMRAAVKTVIE